MEDRDSTVVLDYGTKSRSGFRLARRIVVVGAAFVMLCIAFVTFWPKRPSPTYLAVQAYVDARGLAAALQQYHSTHSQLPARLQDMSYATDRRFQWNYLGTKGSPLNIVAYCWTGWDDRVLVFVDNELTAQSESYEPWVKSMVPKLRALQNGDREESH